MLTGLAASSVVSVLSGCGLASGGDELPPAGTVGNAALLAPLSGPRAQIGQIMQAAASLGGNPVGPGAEVRVLDAGDSPESAVAAARAAVEGGAQMLLGPLFSAQCRAVAQAVGRVPVVALSNDAEIAGGNLFVFGITPAHSARNILGFAAGRGIGRVGIVVPPGDYGARAIAAMQAAAPTFGVEIVPPIVTQNASGIVDRLREAGGGTLPGGVFLPDVSGPFQEFAAALGATETQLLGSEQWSAIEPWRVAGLRGGWFAAPDPLGFEGFALALESETGAEAGIVAGLAFDAVELARLLGRIGQQDRDGLLREAGFEGVLGAYRFRPDGQCDRALAILNVADGSTTLIGATAV